MATPTIFTFDIAAFRVAYPAFKDPVCFPDSTLQLYWDSSWAYISHVDYGFLHGLARLLAINLYTAHLVAISILAKEGEVPGLGQTATVDKVSIGLTPPPLPNQWQWWMNLTPYGQQALALLQTRSVGGFIVGGLPERSAFRQAYGIFPGPGVQ